MSTTPSFRQWWGQQLSNAGLVATLRDFVRALWDFVRESTPAQKRQRYGDVDYDWEHRVDTTSATVGWRDRLLGRLHSRYQPSDPQLFREMMACLDQRLQEFTFIDLGSGKGRALLMASEYGFHEIIGVELLPALHQVALENIRRLCDHGGKSANIESVCGDAREFNFPAGPIVVYLFNPLPEPGLCQVLNKLVTSLRENPRSCYVLYHNPEYEHLLTQSSLFRKVAGTHQFVIYASK